MADAGRVIGGVARGVRLVAPGAGTRPFGDRVKESLFGSLETDPAEPLGGPFLDLYAGSGAAGIEALSRGAPSAVLVEQDAAAIRVITDNLRRTGLAGGRVVRAEVLGWLRRDGVPAGPFRCVVADPPYVDTGALEAVLTVVGAGGPGGRAGGLVGPGGLVVCKHHWRWEGPNVFGLLTRERTKRFGETSLTWYRAGSAAPDPERPAEAH